MVEVFIIVLKPVNFGDVVNSGKIDEKSVVISEALNLKIY